MTWPEKFSNIRENVIDGGDEERDVRCNQSRWMGMMEMRRRGRMTSLFTALKDGVRCWQIEVT